MSILMRRVFNADPLPPRHTDPRIPPPANGIRLMARANTRGRDWPIKVRERSHLSAAAETISARPALGREKWLLRGGQVAGGCHFLASFEESAAFAGSVDARCQMDCSVVEGARRRVDGRVERCRVVTERATLRGTGILRDYAHAYGG